MPQAYCSACGPWFVVFFFNYNKCGHFTSTLVNRREKSILRMCSKLRVLILKRNIVQMASLILLSFFLLMGSWTCICHSVSAHNFVTIPQRCLQCHASCDGEISLYLWESSVSMPLKYSSLLSSGTTPTFDLFLKGNSKMITVDMDLLGLVGLLVETVFQKAPLRGLSPCYPSILDTDSSALLGHLKVAPFEPSSCIH